jgi:transposase
MVTATAQPAETVRRLLTPELSEKIHGLSAMKRIEIAQQLGCSLSTVSKALRRFKLPRKTKTVETAEQETGGLIIIRPTKEMSYMASTRSLSLSAYLLALVDNDLAELRRRQIPPSASTLTNLNGKGVACASHAAKRARIQELIDEGELSIDQIATRTSTSRSTVRRFGAEPREE